jgi:transposase
VVSGSRSREATKLDVDEQTQRLRTLIDLGKKEEALAIITALLKRLLDENGQLVRDVNQLLKKHLGQTSERISSNQLSLFLKLAGISDAEIKSMLGPSSDVAARSAIIGAHLWSSPAAALSAIVGVELSQLLRRRRRREDDGRALWPFGRARGHGRLEFPPNAPRVEIEVEPNEADKWCRDCDVEKKRAGFTTTETLEREPARYKVIVHKCWRFECPCCEAKATAFAPVVIDKGHPGPGLLAQILVAKYMDHLPLHRQHRMYLREGANIPVSTMADWVKVAHELYLSPIARLIFDLALDAYVLRVDDTGIKVRDRESPRGARKGHLWPFLGDQRWLAFVFTRRWEAKEILPYLSEPSGWLVADAYKGFDQIFALRRAIEAGCNAHFRRGFVEALDAGDTRAAIFVALFCELYAIERDIKEAPNELRLERRRAASAPFMNEIGRRIAVIYETEPPKSPLAQAAGYGLRQWQALTRFLEDPRLPIDNTPAERAVRQIAIGRRNFFFVGSDAGGERAATMYSVLGTCALHGVEPIAYLTDVFEKIAGGWPKRRLLELLPPHWAEARARPKHGRAILPAS